MNTPSMSDGGQDIPVDAFEASLRSLRPAAMTADAELALVRKLAFAEGVRSVTVHPASDRSRSLRMWKSVAFSSAAAAVVMVGVLVSVLVAPTGRLRDSTSDLSTQALVNVRPPQSVFEVPAFERVAAHSPPTSAALPPPRRIRSDYLDALRIATRGGLDALRPVGGATTTDTSPVRSWSPLRGDSFKGVLP